MTVENKKMDFRPIDTIMETERLGALHHTRLSFAQRMIRKMARQNWNVSLDKWDMDNNGYGTVIYKLQTPNAQYNFVVLSQYINDEDRNDRVIAEKWDTTFTLVRGEITPEQLENMKSNVPLQEAGRNTSASLVLARANKSVRVFDTIVKALSTGKQPDLETLKNVGYILRTTAVYGNGKFGIADFVVLKDNPDFKEAFCAQMFACYILRQFSMDWVNFLAKAKGGDTAVKLDRNISRFLGIGNATGLGMAPYLINHPQIIDRWLSTREKAISVCRAKPVTQDIIDNIKILMQRAVRHLTEIETINEHQQHLNTTAIADLNTILQNMDFDNWDSFLNANLQYSYEAQEIIISCLIEMYPDDVDAVADMGHIKEDFYLKDGLTVNDMQTLLQRKYQWALDIDFTVPENSYHFWYKSAVKEEPRLGCRNQEDGSDKELPLDIARQVNCFAKALEDFEKDAMFADFLLKNPFYRTISRRVWTLGNSPIGDLQMNVLHKDFLPIHLLRLKLSFLGATKFDPRSDKWVQVTFLQGSPLLDEVHDKEWLFPVLETTES